jgi:hypothetical protein
MSPPSRYGEPGLRMGFNAYLSHCFDYFLRFELEATSPKYFYYAWLFYVSLAT